MSEVRVFHSHIEVYPYKQGDCPELEKIYSKWETYPGGGFSLKPVAYYILNDILYLPRGTSLTILERLFRTEPIIEREYDPYVRIKSGTGLFKAKSRMQDEAMQFLTADGNFAYTGRFSQLGLNLSEGDGKTYATIYAILKLKIRAIIIVHKEDLRELWIKSIIKMTSLPEDRICVATTSVMDEVIKGKHEPKDIYIVTHQSLNSYAREHTWIMVREFFKKIKVGIRVIDEAHRYFHNTLMTDFFSNCYKSFYITATFGRTETSKEIGIYKRAYSSLVRFGEQTANYEEKRKHIIFSPIYFKSNPMYGNPHVETSMGFSNYKYIDYELNKSNVLMKVLRRVLDETSELEGKILIISPKISSVEYIANFVEKNYGPCGVIHSKSKNTKEDETDKRYISATIKSLGEGSDIHGLRCIINLEQVGSKILARQVAGRLREYSKDLDTYLFYPVDLAIPKCSIFLKSILPVMKSKCKEIIFTKMLDL